MDIDIPLEQLASRKSRTVSLAVEADERPSAESAS